MKYYGSISDPKDLVNKEYVDSKYEFIEEIVLAEDTETITRRQTPGGVAYNYKKMLVLLDIPSGGTGNAYCWFQPLESSASLSSIAYVLLSVTKAALYIEANSSFIYTCGISGLGYFESNVKVGNIFANTNSYKIDNLRLSANGTFKAGTKISIYGVKA